MNNSYRLYDLHNRLDSHGNEIFDTLRSHYPDMMISERVLLSILSIQKNVKHVVEGDIFLKWKKKRWWKLHLEKWINTVSHIIQKS